MRLSKDVLAMNLYATLGVPVNATAEQIRRAYRLQAITSHPDIHGTPAERRMVELNLAAYVLLDAARRAEYDRRRGRRASSAARRPQEPAPTPFYPWGFATQPAPEQWAAPRPSQRPDCRDAEVAALLHQVRRGPSRAFRPVLEYAETCSPATHLFVTFASVCIALLLIAIARPSSLMPAHQRSHALACAAENPDG